MRGILIVGLLAVGCAEERPPATEESIVAACETLNREICGSFGRCLGWGAARIAACVADENAECEGDVTPEFCWEAQQSAYERCEDDAADYACSPCDNGFCLFSCPYFCPTPE